MALTRDVRKFENPGQAVERSLPALGSRYVGLGPRCGLRAVARVPTGRSLALAGAARSRTAHHNNSDPPLQRPVCSPLDQRCGFPRRTTGVVLRAEASGGVLVRTPRACAYASGADRPLQRFFVCGVRTCPYLSSCLARALAKKNEHQRVCCKPMAQRDVELGGASRETASGAS